MAEVQGKYFSQSVSRRRRATEWLQAPDSLDHGIISARGSMQQYAFRPVKEADARRAVYSSSPTGAFALICRRIVRPT